MDPARPLETPGTPEPAPVPAPPAPAAAIPRYPLRKSPFLAGLLAGFPGLGNLYNGLYLRGVLFFTAIASLMALGRESDGEAPALGFVIAFLWLFNVIDSYRQAQLINLGYAQDLGLEDRPALPKASQGGLFAGLFFLALGAVSSLQVFFGIEMTWTLHYWPLGLLAIGGWLVWAALRDRAKAGETPEGGEAL